MGLFTKTAPAPVVTTSGLADQLSASLDRNAQKLEARKNSALSSFRRTVLDLRHVNQALENDVALAEQMIATCTARKEAALQEIADNNKVCESITAIIGEVPDGLHYDENEDGECDNCGEGV